MIALVIGDFDTKEMIEKYKSVFGVIPPVNLPTPPVLKYTAPTEKKVYRTEGNTKQTYVNISLDAPKFSDPDYYAFDLMADYLARVVFHVPRSFSPAEFEAAMKAQSKELPGMLDFVRALARRAGNERRGAGDYLLCTLNNESRELNRHRIDTFGLRGLFQAFFSSCYLGVAKPDPAIFRAALELTQAEPGECVLVDDREINVEAAQAAGIHAIQHETLAETQEALAQLGMPVPPGPEPTIAMQER